LEARACSEYPAATRFEKQIFVKSAIFPSAPADQTRSRLATGFLDLNASRIQTRSMTLRDEFQYYLEHQDELVRRFNGKVIVLKDHQVIGSFDSEGEAVREVSKQHELGTFLVQRCEPGTEAYTRTFHSHVLVGSC
jgi:hypothetical protein